MNKKTIVSIILVLILIGIGEGFFWWWQNRGIKGSPEDYVIREMPEGKFVENKKAGLTVKVPKGWEEKVIYIDEGSIVLYSQDVNPDLEDGRISSPLSTGCVIETNVAYEKNDFSQLKLMARYNLALLDMKSVEFEEFTINNYQALKTTADTRKIGSGIGVDIPYKNRTYSFLLIYATDEKQLCMQEFNDFLKIISIN